MKIMFSPKEVAARLSEESLIDKSSMYFTKHGIFDFPN